MVTNRAVEASDTGVLLRLAGLDVPVGKAAFLGAYQRLATDVFRAAGHSLNEAFLVPQDRPTRRIASPLPVGQRVICTSVDLLVFIQTLLVHLGARFLPVQPLAVGGITQPHFKVFAAIAVANIGRQWAFAPSGPG